MWLCLSSLEREKQRERLPIRLCVVERQAIGTSFPSRFALTSLQSPLSSAMTKTEIPSKTPPRHNYANPHTPIASIKRPRSSLERPGTNKQQLASPGLSVKTPGTVNRIDTNGTVTSPMPPRPSRRSDENAMSPMHPPKAVHREPNDHVEEEDTSWVGRKVDALFSPVLSFLSQHESPDALKDDNLTEAPTASESSSSPSHGSTPEDEDHDIEDEVSCGSLQPMEEDHADDDEFNPWQYIKTLPPYGVVSHLCPKVTLPAKSPSAPPITLVLDLDETLVHCTVEAIPDADLTFPVEFHGATYQVHVRLRPFLKNFLKKIQGNYEVIVFTASQKVYADELLNLIDPGMQEVGRSPYVNGSISHLYLLMHRWNLYPTPLVPGVLHGG